MQKQNESVSSRSLLSSGARQHMGIAVALITIIPILALVTLTINSWSQSGSIDVHTIVVVGFALTGILLGYSLLSKYPANILRLRRYLEVMVNGQLPEEVNLVRSMDDISAVEYALNALIGQLREQVVRREKELSRLESLTSKSSIPGFWHDAHEDGARDQFGGDRADLIRASLGDRMLSGILVDLVGLLETRAVVYERNGEEAASEVISEWCKTLCSQDDGGSVSTCAAAAHESMNSHHPVDISCNCGMRAYFAPVGPEENTIGSIGFAYGDPPRDDEAVRSVADSVGLDFRELKEKAVAYESHPQLLVSVVKHRLLTLSKFIGEVVYRKQASAILRANQEELREHRDCLEELIELRTAELKDVNAKLHEEVLQRLKAEKLKDEFVSTVSHELRTPLAIAKSGIDLIADRIPGPLNAKQEDVLKTASRNMDRLTRIINDLLDISRIEAGGMVIQKEKLDVVELVESATGSLRELAGKKDLELRVEFSERPIHVSADGGRIVQVLTNLLYNGIKFTDVGNVCVAVSKDEDSAECSITDTGMGIAQSDVPRVFEKFRQFGRKDGAGIKGTGLGLAICRSIINLHRGQISVTSTLGKGSCFSFTLPLWNEDSVLKDAIDDKIEASKNVGDVFSVFLVDATCETDMAEGVKAVEVVQKGLRNLLEAAPVRASDAIFAGKDGRQVVLLVKIEPREIDGLKSRLRLQADEIFLSIDPDVKIRLSFRYASYPDDAHRSDELLKKAESAPTE